MAKGTGRIGNTVCYQLVNECDMKCAGLHPVQGVPMGLLWPLIRIYMVFSHKVGCTAVVFITDTLNTYLAPSATINYHLLCIFTNIAIENLAFRSPRISELDMFQDKEKKKQT